jgi:anti-sigma factor RsiW
MRISPRGKPREEELAALADGSLPARRVEELEAQIAESPELADRLAEQQRAIAFVRGAAAEVEAPASLRTRVEAGQQRGRRSRLGSRPFALAGGIAVATVAALVLVLTLPSGAGGPGLAEAAALATMPATEPAPEVDAAAPKLLDEAVSEVPFPNWLTKFGWRATGVRADTVGGRETTTVFYEKNGRRIAYTIVAGKPLDIPAEADRSRREGVELHALALDGREVVTWKRGGMTCILSGDVVDRGTLLKLAAWNGEGEVPF